MAKEKPAYKLRKEDFIPMDGLDRYYPERNKNVCDKHTIPRSLILTMYNAGLVISGVATTGALLGAGMAGCIKGLESLLK